VLLSPLLSKKWTPLSVPRIVESDIGTTFFRATSVSKRLRGRTLGQLESTESIIEAGFLYNDLRSGLHLEQCLVLKLISSHIGRWASELTQLSKSCVKSLLAHLLRCLRYVTLLGLAKPV
jgi:hypothetical protein